MFENLQSKSFWPPGDGESALLTIGVLSFQGDVSEHLEMLKVLGVKSMPIGRPYELEVVDGLIIPGGESTTVGRLLKETGMDLAVRNRAEEGMPVWGTCMGAILIAKKLIENPIEQSILGLMNISVRRNAFGRQQESFEEEISIPILKDPGFPCVFIRAPQIEEVGPGVETLAEFQGKPVLVREKNLMASAFHPEISRDPRIHRLFVEMNKGRGLTN